MPHELALQHPHPWDLTSTEAVALQRELAPRVRVGPLPHQVATVAGIDVSVRGDRARAAVVVMRLPEAMQLPEVAELAQEAMEEAAVGIIRLSENVTEAALELVETATHETSLSFPYVPGLLSFREIPAALTALARLRTTPDLLICDGHGYAHPRRFGLACHLGVLLDHPTVGVAKSRLVGAHTEPGPAKGAWTALRHRGETIGAVLRTRARVKPVFVSVGHRVTLAQAMALTLACTPRYRLPEPLRRAHRLSRGEG